jgi:NADH:ubiquinone oxidoreductase subunit
MKEKRAMSIAIYFRTLLRGRLVGEDPQGNKYYEDKKKLRYGKPRRWVLYNGFAEASKIPAQWHGWLHFTVNEPPLDPTLHVWEKEHLPNLTGTPYAHKPKGLRGEVATKDYVAWRP